MDQISNLVALVKAHWVEVLAALGAIDLLLGLITKWTPTEWDDNLYAIIHSGISKLAGKGK